jgi:potassium-transporting ATPase potassium-binding subunit
MNIYGWLQIIMYLAVILTLMKPLGSYMARVYGGEKTLLHPIFGPVERLIYRLAGVRPDADMNWKEYALALLLFNVLGILGVYALQRLQAWLPLNPMKFGPVTPHQAFNTAVSFATNTNWQSYGGETTMSYLTQMLGLAVQNFLSAATGMAAVIAFIRGFARATAKGLGNAWVDLVRSTLYVFLPLAFITALILVSQGVVQNLRPYQAVSLLQPTSYEKPKLDGAGQPLKDAQGKAITETVIVNAQVLPQGPAASQIAIKQLGVNGGGFFNANSAHPFENPTPLSNFVEMLVIFLISGALCYTFGKMVGDTRQGWAVLTAMTIIFCTMLGVAEWAEHGGNPALSRLGGIDQNAGPLQAGGNMEGKEVRFGITASALFATITTAASCGAVNSMHDSFTPLGGLVPLWLMEIGGVIFGGNGSGLYGMLIYVIIAVFVAGLMVGRTPEYLGKKIEAYEMKMASLAILVPMLLPLLGTALAVLFPAGTSSVANPGPHGFSEILYAFSSGVGNNGSAFGGLNANTLFYNTSIAVMMFFGRYWILIPVLAIAGSLSLKKLVPPSSGTLETHTPLFIAWLVGVVVVVAALNFLPALALGPIVEHLLLY